MNKHFIPLIVILLCATSMSFAGIEAKAEFKHTLALAPSDHIILDVEVGQGDVTIGYRHAGEISIAATARFLDGKPVAQDFFDHCLTVRRNGDHVEVRATPATAYSERQLKISYAIDVPNWIEINSKAKNGNQAVAGVMGPVRVESGRGDIRISYVTTTLEAKTGEGNITVIRVGSAAKVETGSGNINMKDIGPSSTARVLRGTGRIEMDGVSGSFSGSTDGGELDAKGGVFDDWDLKSVSGNIRIGVATEQRFDLDVATQSGSLLIENDDIDAPQDAKTRECRQKVNGGGKYVRARSVSGTIFVR
jgi:hypothetical protein